MWLSLLGCGERGVLDCPALGTAPAVGTAPELSAESTVQGCRDASAWFDEVERLETAWTIDLGAISQYPTTQPHVLAGSEAAFVHVGSRIFHVGPEGQARVLTTSVSAATLVDDTLVLYDFTTGFLRFFDAEGTLVWTKGQTTFAIDDMAGSGRGTLVLGSSGGFVRCWSRSAACKASCSAA